MSSYDEARDLVITELDSILVKVAPESNETGAEESVRSIHVQSIVYRRMDQV